MPMSRMKPVLERILAAELPIRVISQLVRPYRLSIQPELCLTNPIPLSDFARVIKERVKLAS